MGAPEYRHDLTAAQVRGALHYDPETGIFTWRHRPDMPASWNTRYAGSEAGRIRPPRGSSTKAYRVISLYKRLYLAHRLAWLYMTGEWPEGLLDHEDGDGLHNRWENLRPSTRSENSANCNRPLNNTSGFKGVTWDKSRGKWIAQICVRGRRRHLGRFTDVTEAHEAYRRAAIEAFGDFARTS